MTRLAFKAGAAWQANIDAQRTERTRKGRLDSFEV